MSATVENLPLKAKGERPYFFDEPALDKLTAMLLALMGELSVESERNDSLVRLLEEKGVLSAEELASYRPGDKVMHEREARRQALLASVFRVVLQEVEGMEKAERA